MKCFLEAKHYGMVKHVVFSTLLLVGWKLDASNTAIQVLLARFGRHGWDRRMMVLVHNTVYIIVDRRVCGTSLFDFYFYITRTIYSSACVTMAGYDKPSVTCRWMMPMNDVLL